MVQSPLQQYIVLLDTSFLKKTSIISLMLWAIDSQLEENYNAKHTQWGSRLITVRDKNLLNSINTKNVNYLTTYEPTYSFTDTKKIPDLLDFFITKNISPRYVQINSSAELSSDHSPVIATISSTIIENPPNGFINQFTNWQLFREVFSHSISVLISLKTNEDVETATET